MHIHKRVKLLFFIMVLIMAVLNAIIDKHKNLVKKMIVKTLNVESLFKYCSGFGILLLFKSTVICPLVPIHLFS